MRDIMTYIPIVALILTIVNSWAIYYVGRPPEGREAFMLFLKRSATRTKRFVGNILPFVTAAYMVVIVFTIELPLTRYGLSVVMTGTFATAFTFCVLIINKSRLKTRTAQLQNLLTLEFLVGNTTALYPNLLSKLMYSKALKADDAELFIQKLQAVTKLYEERHENFDKLLEE